MAEKPNIKWNSFDDRINDDLCIVLLSYLTLTQKLTFARVSHQWKRCGLERHTDLILTASTLPYKVSEPANYQSYILHLDSLLDRLPRLHRLIFRNFSIFDRTLITLMNRSPDKLILFEIDLNLGSCFERTVVDFIKRFGPDLKSIAIRGRYWPKLFSLCPKVTKITCTDTLWMPHDFSIFTELQTINFTLYPIFCSIDSLLNRKGYSLSKISLTIVPYSRYQGDFLHMICDFIASNKYLKFLDLDVQKNADPTLENHHESNYLENALRKVFRNCTKLLYVSLTVNTSDFAMETRILQAINSFCPRLHRLYFKNIFKEYHNPSYIALDNLKHLTHLSIMGNFNLDILYMGADVDFPNLRYLEIFPPFINDRTLFDLSFHKQLNIVVGPGINYSISSNYTNAGLTDFILNGPKLTAYFCSDEFTQKLVMDVFKERFDEDDEELS